MSLMKSISFKLIMAALVTVTILVVVFGVYDYIIQSEKLQHKQDAQITLVASRLQLSLPSAVWNYEESQMVRILNSEQQSEDVAFLSLHNDKGEQIAQSAGELGSRFEEVKLQYIEDETATDIGSVKVYIDNTSIKEELSSLAFRLIIKALLLDIFLVTALSLLFSRVVTRPLTHVANALENIASGEGDLTRRLNASRDDEIGRVSNSFNVFVEKIQTLVQSIQVSVDDVFREARNVHTGAEASRGHVHDQQMETDQVAAAITQMSASAKEIASSVQLSAESALQANVDAKEVSTIINQSINSIQDLSSQLTEAASVVNSLEKNVVGIVSVLDVIRAIAEQTNLLALNAAIEAARAGEQGRGFAVVADEVRALASRTQQSTAEIQLSITNLQAGAKSAVKVMLESQTKSEASVKNAQSSGTAINSILASTEKITDMASHIATAVEQQSAVSEDLTHNINRIVTSGQDNLNQLDVMNKNSESLETTSKTLKKLTSQFKA
ncbi:chemotaxis sensory transducer [Shewanella denitrificans OS217]|uniref:Chemotaxis sensory transducer n=1 Tax=Shewanella denitrificans (strain OS217 / ATCC BAA-1090 / DSM 15013) TaxID=318161 RepID=Q12JZ3_SHEDO|nr:methyl-accepting chemotaxis protein [Shewanella denitrificans]ABE56233.1 chemotaxis sensory transducer [Shewanella denitrificans OS217]